MAPTLRIARPTDQLDAIAGMYCDGLGLERLGGFTDHGGFDGVILGRPDWVYHLEFTHPRGHVVGRAPTQDILLVLYVPDSAAWHEQCAQMRRAGFVEAASYNPYWDRDGVTFEDVDGYRVVLKNAPWTPG